MSHPSAGARSKPSSGHVAKQRTESKTNTSAKTGASAGNGIDRAGMISVAAYFRAEHRGFDGGDALADWLAAEAEIDAMLDDRKEISIH